MLRRVKETVEQITIGIDTRHVHRRTYRDWVINIPNRETGSSNVKFGIDDEVAGSFEIVRVGDRQAARRI